MESNQRAYTQICRTFHGQVWKQCSGKVCLSCCEDISNYDIIFEILEGNHRDRFIQICTNQYGNYVVQKAMSIAKVCF